jgi:hypothetical protein
MQYVCEGSPKATWFRIETVGEAATESDLMNHAVEKHFRTAREHAIATYAPPPGRFIEQDIGLEAHVRRVMPIFLTLRDPLGNGLATAMLPASDRDPKSRPIIVGLGNSDPYPQHGDAIACLGEHFGLTLDRARCYPYR